MSLTKEQCFEQLLLGKTVKSEGWLERIRNEALEHAVTLNFPSARHDDWRFTDLSSLFMHGFHPVDSYAKLNPGDIEKFQIPGAVRLVFVDGCYSPELSDLKNGEAGVTAQPHLRNVRVIDCSSRISAGMRHTGRIRLSR
jgi:Fe-S cluster assembly protein SufD